MELHLVFLLCWASCPLSQALPLLITGGDVQDSFNDAEVDKRIVSKIIQEASKDMVNDEEVEFRPVSDIIEKVNKGVTIPLTEGDIRPNIDRSVTECTSCLWTKSHDGRVQVPYVALSPTYTNFERSMFISAMKEFEVMTCVQFVNRSTETDYLSFVDGTGCWSFVGKMGGKQTASLSMKGCIMYNLIQHELMHALGFYHEFTRRDRDNYVDIMWQNIAPENQDVFYLDGGNIQDMPYDYNSIVHYTQYALSKISGQPSMVAKPNPNVPMGQAIGLDNLDVMKINNIYNCNLCRQKLFTPGSSTYSSTSSVQGGAYCLYLIQSILKVLLQLSNLNIPSSPGCNDSYIKVYDGVSQSSTVLLEKTCGNGSVPLLISSGSFMLIEIVNNQPSALSTFTASYQTVRYGGTYLTDNGEVTSPGFPSMYPSNVDVVYSIIAPIGRKVSLTFYFFITKPSPNCSIDFLMVNDGPLKTSPILGTYCGNMDIPLSLESTGNVMILQFHSGNSSGYNGFYAQYKFVTTAK